MALIQSVLNANMCSPNACEGEKAGLTFMSWVMRVDNKLHYSSLEEMLEL